MRTSGPSPLAARWGRRALLPLLALCSGSLFAQNAPSNPLPLWRRAVGGTLIAPPAVKGAEIVSLVEGGRVVAAGRSGRALWSYRAAGPLTPYLTLAEDGACYVCQTDGLLISLNIAGSRRWSRRLDGPIVAPPLSGWDGRLFVLTGQSLTCFTEAGQRLWRLRPRDSVTLPPVLDGQGGLLAVLEGGGVLLASAFGKAAVLPLERQPALLLSASLAQGSGAQTKSGAEFALVYEDGRLETWKGNLRLHVFESALASRLGGVPRLGEVWNGLSLILDSGNALSLVSLEDGRVFWTAQAAATPERIVFDRRGVFLLSKSEVCALSAESGQTLWRQRFSLLAAAPTLSDDGRIYAGGSDWLLYAYAAGTGKPLPAEISANAAPLVPSAAFPRDGYKTGSLRTVVTLEDKRSARESLASEFARIAKALEAGEVGENERGFKALLMSVAACGTGLSGAIPFDTAPTLTEKIQALELLSRLGSREALSFLCELWPREREDAVKEAIAACIGKIGVDPAHSALNIFARELARPVALHDSLYAAIACALGSLCRFSGPLYSADVIPLLTTLADTTNLKHASSQARFELEHLVDDSEPQT